MNPDATEVVAAGGAAAEVDVVSEVDALSGPFDQTAEVGKRLEGSARAKRRALRIRQTLHAVFYM